MASLLSKIVFQTVSMLQKFFPKGFNAPKIVFQMVSILTNWSLTPFQRQFLDHWHRLEEKFWKHWDNEFVHIVFLVRKLISLKCQNNIIRDRVPLTYILPNFKADFFKSPKTRSLSWKYIRKKGGNICTKKWR